MDVKEVLRKAVEEHASDIFIIAGLPISYRSNNVIIKEEGERLMPPETENYLEQIYELADHRDIDRLLKHGDDDFSFAVGGETVGQSVVVHAEDKRVTALERED